MSSRSRTHRPTKTCASCGRTMVWRRRWAACWDEVRHCSERCRRRRPGARDRALEQAMLRAVAARPEGSLCPSEIARAEAGEAWRGRLEAVRSAARRLAAQGALEVCQGGHAVDASTACGPIRIRRTRGRSADGCASDPRFQPHERRDR